MNKADILKWFAIASAIISVLFWVYNFVGDSSKQVLILEQTTFDSGHQKGVVIDHVKNAPDEADTRELNIEIKRVLKNVQKNENDAIESRAKRDKRGKERDSIQDLNNVTIFQLKQTMEEQTQINKQILQKLE